MVVASLSIANRSGPCWSSASGCLVYKVLDAPIIEKGKNPMSSLVCC